MNSNKSPNVIPTHPKYYLADVPRELRRRVLDLCTKRLWQDARDLLQQRGFDQYTFDDLQSFYDWAPAELPQPARNAPVLDQPNRAATVRERSADFPEPRAVSAERPDPIGTEPLPLVGQDALRQSSLDSGCGEAQPQHTRSITDDGPPTAASLDCSSPQQLITDDRSLPASPPSTTRFPATLPPSPSVAKSRRSSHRPRKRRSKITRLPKEIREELNSRLENGATYVSVIDWLAAKGHSDFNETNLSWWKNGGYQDWLRDEERKQESHALRDWAAALAGRKDPTILANALSNFTGAKLHRLLCSLDYEGLARELQARPEVCIRYFNTAIRTGRVSLEAARVDHLVQPTRDKRAPTTAEIEDIERRLNLL